MRATPLGTYGQTEVEAGAYVKIPGLHPSESGALPYLSLGELEKLQMRVEQAIARAKRKAETEAARAQFIPGTCVTFVSPFYRFTRGAKGVVVHDGNLVSRGSEHSVPVAIAGFGLTWVPVSYLKIGW
jgi:hypothetical protein